MSGQGEFRDHHSIDAASDEEVARAIWRNDNVELLTIGVDIGSATSHLMFSRLHLQRMSQAYSSRFVVVEREALYRSPIHLTPYLGDGGIAVDALRTHIDAAYREAGIERAQVDAGAVILTGVAVERSNARRIAELFAAEGGKFVCATAGHNLEALLAAHGSGAVALSRSGGPVLNIDVGGGTTKFALADDGHVVATFAIVAGSRLIELDSSERLVRIEHGAAELAAELGIALRVGAPLTADARRRLADGFAKRIVQSANGRTPDAIRLAGGLPASPPPAAIVISGGVGELLGVATNESFGDLGHELATALRARAAELPAPIVAGAEPIRATVIGASQFSVQLSGNTVHISDDASLPMHNIPVVAVDLSRGTLEESAVVRAIERGVDRLDLATSADPIAIAVTFDGDPRYATLRALAGGIAAAHRESPRRSSTLIVALTGDVGASLGHIFASELGIHGSVIVIDGLELADLDYIDIGQRLLPANVVPVVVKSLVFAPAGEPSQTG